MSKTTEKFQGKPCGYGHAGVRYRSSGGCVLCLQIASAKRREARKSSVTPGATT